VLFVWGGLAVTYYTKFPVGFLITAFAFVAYVAVRLLPGVRGLGAGHRHHAGGRAPADLLGY
jgi:hypothetical protein